MKVEAKLRRQEVGPGTGGGVIVGRSRWESSVSPSMYYIVKFSKIHFKTLNLF